MPLAQAAHEGALFMSCEIFTPKLHRKLALISSVKIDDYINRGYEHGTDYVVVHSLQG